jgi:hypothetical protein
MHTQERGIRFRDGRLLDFLGTEWEIEVDETADEVNFTHETNGTRFTLGADGGFDIPGDFEVFSDLVFSGSDWSITTIDGNLVFENSVTGSQFTYNSNGNFDIDSSFDFAQESVEFSNITATQSITDATGTEHTVELLDQSDTGTPGGLATLDSQGLIEKDQFPDLAINQVHVATSGETRTSIATSQSIDIQEGDVVIETDPDPSEVYISTGGDTSIESNWELIGLKSESVTSVFGREGDIQPQYGDYDPAMVGVEGEAVAIGAPTVSTTADLPDPASYPLGTRFFVLEENESYEVKNA